VIELKDTIYKLVPYHTSLHEFHLDYYMHACIHYAAEWSGWWLAIQSKEKAKSQRVVWLIVHAFDW